jgi:hypothetical protein
MKLMSKIGKEEEEEEEEEEGNEIVSDGCVDEDFCFASKRCWISTTSCIWAGIGRW